MEILAKSNRRTQSFRSMTAQQKSLRESFNSISIPLLPLFIAPQQRQRWGEKQRHPHKDWGDIFYDLFFVAAAYNLGNVLREDPTARGLLYFLGCFLPLNYIWQRKVTFDARFYRQEDLWHFLYESLVLLALASTVQHIRPVAILAFPAENGEMFGLALSIMASLILSMGRSLEIILCQKFLAENQERMDVDEQKEGHEEMEDDDDQDDEGDHGDSGNSKAAGLDPEAATCSLQDIISLFPSILLAAAASIYAGLEFYGSSRETSTSYGEADTGGYPGKRFLAAGGATGGADDADDLPMYLLVSTIVPSTLYFFLSRLYFQWKNIELSKTIVPINVGYTIHRYGEWTMLMLGETVLSLLIVTYSHDVDYYKTFYFGFVSIFLLEYLHFRSQPHDAEHHAFRRSVNGSIAFIHLMLLYSSALVIFGASYKMLLYEYTYEREANEKTTSSYGGTGDVETGTDNYGQYDEEDGHRNLLSMILPRMLAGGESAALRFDTDHRQQLIAHFFCGSLTLIWFSLDAMSLAHRGLENSREAYRNSGHPYMFPILLAVRVGLLVWCATLSQYVHDPHLLSLLGLLGIFAQVCLRIAVFYITPRNEEEQEMKAIEKTLAYTAARIRQSG